MDRKAGRPSVRHRRNQACTLTRETPTAAATSVTDAPLNTDHTESGGALTVILSGHRRSLWIGGRV